MRIHLLAVAALTRLGAMLARVPLTLCSPGGAGLLTLAGASWRQVAPFAVALLRAAFPA